jgi:UDPglucose 6-dehydrogenase
MDPRSSELTKYAANAFLATKISFINEIAGLCEAVGADVDLVAKGIGLDPRIGKEFLRAGLGWGGSCFPKDVLAISTLGTSFSQALPIVNAAIQTNKAVRERVAERLLDVLGSLENKIIGVLGIAFKENTDDIRESPALDVIRVLCRQGALVQAHDPVARLAESPEIRAKQVADPYAAASGAEALVIATEWDEFRALDLDRLKQAMKGNVIMDARNMLKPQEVLAKGFNYLRIGKKFKM